MKDKALRYQHFCDSIAFSAYSHVNDKQLIAAK